jgi:fused signal recognition particle receptor
MPGMFRRKSPDSAATSKPEEKQGFFKRLRAKLNRGNSWLTYDLADLFRGRKIDAQILEELESRLLTADACA